MAKVPLTPIGSPRSNFLDEKSFQKNHAHLEERVVEL
ncbi:MAG: hypothetical protein ACI89E_001457, partial [Planctomycetota bacterium]